MSNTERKVTGCGIFSFGVSYYPLTWKNTIKFGNCDCPDKRKVVDVGSRNTCHRRQGGSSFYKDSVRAEADYDSLMEVEA